MSLDVLLGIILIATNNQNREVVAVTAFIFMEGIRDCEFVTHMAVTIMVFSLGDYDYSSPIRAR